MKPTDRQGGPARRFVLGMVALQALPFLLALAVMRERRPLPDALQPMATVPLSAPIAEIRSEIDPGGSQVAVLTRDAAVHELTLRGGVPHRRRVALPLSPEKVGGCTLVYGDLNDDRRSDLVVSCRRDPPHPPAALWLPATGGGLAPPRPAPARATMLRSPRGSRACQRSGHTVRLGDEGLGRGMTRVSNLSGRTTQLLPGLLAAIGDLDGDGSDELVTVAAGADLQEAVLRLFGFDGQHLREVWRHRLQDASLARRYHPSGVLNLDPLVATADLDQDGRAELLVGSESEGSLTFWQWARD